MGSMASINAAVLVHGTMATTGEISAFWVLIERACRLKGWTPTELGRRAGIGWASFRKYALLGTSPTEKTLAKLSEATGMPKAAFLHEPGPKAQEEAGHLFRGLWFETGIRLLRELAEVLEIPQERLEECALGRSSLNAGETRQLVEIIHHRNKVATHAAASKVSDGGGPVKRADVDRILDNAEAAAMDDNDRAALAILLRKRDVPQLLGELQELAKPSARPRKR